MNTKLEKLFKQHDFSQKDVYDFMQIYNLMPDYKRVKAIENFQQVADSIKSLRSDLLKEQEILFGKTLDTIEKRLQQQKKISLSSSTRSEIQHLKAMI